MSLTPGTRLGPYEILSRVGAGGMGEVYRARDTRLDRIVAVKIILDSAASTSVAQQLFAREARAIASISHPNICTLYDVGTHERTDFIVMEYLEGETLAARLSRQKVTAGRLARRDIQGSDPAGLDTTPTRTPLALTEVLEIARQLAEGLAAAHRAGVLHADLKPGNVMLTPTGVKVLDFGLARLRAVSDSPGIGSMQTTITGPLSEPVVLRGTLPYMAPEQLQGRAVDARTDIFAFGAIVYEMATGRRAFSGQSTSSLITAILEKDPDPITATEPLTPPGLDRLVCKCLAKSPDVRWQSAADLADEFRWLSSDSASTAPRPGLSRPGRRHWARRIAGLLSIVALAALAVWRWQTSVSPSEPHVEPQYIQATYDGNILAAALSPDGKTVAYSTGEQLHDVHVFVRDLSGGQPLEVWKGTSAADLNWIPDGSRLLIASLSEVWMVPRLGGPARRLAATPAGFVAASVDGLRVVGGLEGFAGFDVRDLAGGPARRISLDPIFSAEGIDWNPSSDRVVLLSRNPAGEYGIWSVVPDGKDLRRLYTDSEPISAICSSPVASTVYFLRQRNGASELTSLSVTGPPNQVPRVLATGLQTGSGRCSVSADGERFAYNRETTRENLWRLDRAASSPIETALTHGTGVIGLPTMSPDGESLVAISGLPRSTRQLVKMRVSGGEPVPLGEGSSPDWSVDGKHLAFLSSRTGRLQLLVSDEEGQNHQEIPGGGVDWASPTWLPDHRLGFRTADGRNYRIRELSTGQEEPLVLTPEVGWVIAMRFASSGRHVAINWTRATATGPDQALWLLSWPAREAQYIADNLLPFGWSPDDEWIYAYVSQGRRVVRVSSKNFSVQPLHDFTRGIVDGCATSSVTEAPIVCAIDESTHDAWIIEHFDPARSPRPK